MPPLPNELAETERPSWLPNDGNIYMKSDEASDLLLLDMFRRYKGIDSEVDARMDAYIGILLNEPTIKSVPARNVFEPLIPFYFEGEPGVGKTSICEMTARRFCAICGLNFVMEPQADYVFKPLDAYYMVSSLQGQTNAMSIGGMPTRGQLASPQAASAWAIDAAAAKAETLAAVFGCSSTTQRQSADARDSLTIIFEGDPTTMRQASAILRQQLVDGARERGFGFAAPEAGRSDPDRTYMAEMEKDGKLFVRIDAPKALSSEARYVSEMLPNRRFAAATQARFTFCVFDDIANASPPVRNVILEIAQKNRYSGVADLGNAVVMLTGNQGFEDGTNTMSDQSDAEVSRVRKIRIYDTPEAWADRVEAKYGSTEAGDCFFASFIREYGHLDGIFRPLPGADRSAKGIPKANSRSLENALSAVHPYFTMAMQSQLSPLVFASQISNAVHMTASEQVSVAYDAHIKGMLSEATPMASKLIETGECDFEALGDKVNGALRASEQDFSFMFSSALVNGFVRRVQFSPEALACAGDPVAHNKLVTETMSRMASGLAMLQQDKLTLCMSQLMNRLSSFERYGTVSGARLQVRESFADALAAGFRTSVERGEWEDPEAASNDFAAVTSSNNASQDVASRPQPGRRI